MTRVGQTAAWQILPRHLRLPQPRWAANASNLSCKSYLNMESNSFPRSRRLRKTSEFQAVRQNGTRVGNNVLVIWMQPNGTAQHRLGLSVSRRVGNAVRRNLWKRLIREVFRTFKTAPTSRVQGEPTVEPIGYDFVVSPSRFAEKPSFAAVKEAFAKLVRRF